MRVLGGAEYKGNRKEIVNTLTSFQKVNKSFDRNSCIGKARRAVHDSFIDSDDLS
jgi:hypothetical protein